MRYLIVIGLETSHEQRVVTKNPSFDGVHVPLQKQHSEHKPNYIDLWFPKPNTSQLEEDT